MPEGIASAEELTTRAVGAFSLDTSVIQAASFSFASGALARLSDQLPPWMHLWLTDIVAREVMQHRMDGVRRAVQQIRGAQADLTRFLAGSKITFPSDPETYVRTAVYHFEAQFQGFLKAHRGTILEPQSGGLMTQVFQRYFDQSPPFGGGRDKKHEFPDAASLLMLEEHARRQGTKVIAISADEGWRKFARNSEMVYCVPTLSELTDLFLATSQTMQVFATRIVLLLESEAFQQRVHRLLSKQLTTLPWVINGTHGYAYDVDAGVVNAILDSFQIKSASLRLWSTAHDESACVAHVAVEVESRIEIEAYAYERRYKSLEKEDLAHTSLVVSQGLEVSLALEFLDIDPDGDAGEALRQVSILSDPLHVHVGRWRFPGLPERRSGFSLDDLDDDLPF